jgi:hypothetical protein
VHITFRNDVFDDSLYEHLKRAGIENATISESEAGIEDRFLELMTTENTSSSKGVGGM